jgi:hypothetical protein
MRNHPQSCITIVQLHSKQKQQTLGIAHCNPPKKCTSGKNISFSSAATWQYSFQARILSPSECKKLLNMEKEVDCKFTDLNMRRRVHSTYPW